MDVSKNHWLFRPLVIVIACLILQSPAEAESYKKIMNKGFSAYRSENFSEAARHFKTALKKKKTAEAYKFLGHAHYNRNRYDKAERAFKNALSRNENLTKLNFYLGQIYMQTDRSAQAVRATRKALSGGYRDVEVYALLGSALQATGEKDLALNAYSEALMMSGGTPEFRVNVIRILMSLGRHDRAFRHAINLTEQHPADSSYRLLLARTAIKSRRLGRAERALTYADLLGSTRPALFRTLADLHMKNGRFREAVRLYRAFISRTDHPDADDYYRLGVSEIETDEFESARTHLTKAAEMDASRVDGLLQLARELNQTRSFQEARPVLDKILDVDPDNTNTLVYLGNRWFEQNRPKKAVDSYRKAFESGLRTENFLFNYLQTLIETGKNKRTRRVFQVSIARYPDSTDIKRLLNQWIKNTSNDRKN